MAALHAGSTPQTAAADPPLKVGVKAAFGIGSAAEAIAHFSLGSYARYLRESVAGIKGSDDIVGDPIGKDMLLNELEYEMIPYSPEQLVTIANEEFAWCEAEMKKASKEMGFGDNWKQALEKVKTLHVEPGQRE